MKKCLWLLAALLFVSGCTSDDASTGKDGGGDTGDIVCESGEHVYADECEADSLTSCGSHDNDCAKLEGWKAGDCTGGKCVASECADGYELKDGVCASGAASPAECGEGKHSHESACEDDSLENCGGHGNDCAKQEGWKAGACTGGKCVPSECAENYELKDGACVSGTAAPTECEAGKHAYEDTCEDDSPENCGSHGNKCADLEGWKDGNCTDGKCVASECAENFELKEGKCEAAGSECEAGKHAHEGGCEDDSDENCGSHGNKCAELEGWKAGACTDGKCVASECAENFELKEGKCEAAGSECEAGKHAYDGGCEDDSDDNCGKHDNKCADLEGWKDGKCTDGKCVASECEAGYKLNNDLCVKEGGVTCSKGEHVYGNGCEKDTVKDCGSHGNDCTKLTGWSEGNCGTGVCVITKCASGYTLKDGQCIKNGLTCKANQHVWDGKCEDDTVENCGKHGNDCTKAEGWNQGICSNKKCVVSRCNQSYCIKNGVCVDGMSNVNACGGIGKQCIACDANQTCSEGICKEKGSEPECKANQHVWNGGCEDDSVNNCGSHGNDCTKAEGWQIGTCTGGKCLVGKCTSGYCISQKKCVQGYSDVNACGIVGKQCLTCDANQSCTNGICQDKSVNCAADEHKYGTGCEKNTDENCGSHGNVCNTGKIAHSSKVHCSTSGVCTLDQCVEGYSTNGNVCASVCSGSTRYYCAKNKGCCSLANCEGFCQTSI